MLNCYYLLSLTSMIHYNYEAMLCYLNTALEAVQRTLFERLANIYQ